MKPFIGVAQCHPAKPEVASFLQPPLTLAVHVFPFPDSAATSPPCAEPRLTHPPLHLPQKLNEPRPSEAALRPHCLLEASMSALLPTLPLAGKIHPSNLILVSSSYPPHITHHILVYLTLLTPLLFAADGTLAPSHLHQGGANL